MVLIWGRSAARGTWHVPPHHGLPKNSHAPTVQTGGITDPKLTGHTHTVLYLFLNNRRRDDPLRDEVSNLKSIGGAVPVECMLHAPEVDNIFHLGSSGSRKLRASDTKFGTWVHLDKAYLAPYQDIDCGALCTCSARPNVLYL